VCAFGVYTVRVMKTKATEAGTGAQVGAGMLASALTPDPPPTPTPLHDGAVLFFPIHRFNSISFTRAQGIPKYKIGFRKEKDGVLLDLSIRYPSTQCVPTCQMGLGRGGAVLALALAQWGYSLLNL
jgi:hypothetical protein